ncbi:unnamed protein product [Closterium sp. Naga37s-1]|nr:unnamed protein product [Closterium sp. Naga37s-1]
MKLLYDDRDEDSEYFQHSLFIVLCNRLMTCAVAVIVHLVSQSPLSRCSNVRLSNIFLFIMLLCNRLMTCAVAVIVHLVTGASLALVAPIYAYGAVSLSNVISSGCQYEALKYVSFPLQTIAKSSRMMPVLVSPVTRPGAM